MSSTLQAFFDELGPMLRSQRRADAVEAVLGPCPSGTAALGFYAELVARNYRKILGDVFACTTALACRTEPTRWRELVDAYVRAHVATGIDPNGYAAAFPQWLQTQPGYVPAWAELADFEWLRVLAHHAPDGDDDGFERRLFVRQYTFHVTGFFAAWTRDRAAPDPIAQISIAIVFRHARTLQVLVHHPRATGLAALARRQGLALPEPLAGLDPAQIEEAEHALVRAGVLP